MASTTTYSFVNLNGELGVNSMWREGEIFTVTGIFFSFNPNKIFLPLILQDPKSIKRVSMTWCVIHKSFFQGIIFNCGDMESLRFFDCRISFSTFVKYFTKPFVEKFKIIEFHHVRIVGNPNDFEPGTHRFKIPPDMYFHNNLTHLLKADEMFDMFEIDFKIIDGKASLLSAIPQTWLHSKDEEIPFDYIETLPFREKRPRIG